MSGTLLTGVNGGSYVGTATAPASGDQVTGASVQVAGQAILDDAAFLNADKLSKSLGGTVAGALTVSGKMTVSGRRVRGARVDLTGSDTNHTLLVTDGNRFELKKNPASVRTITIDKLTAVPVANETIEVMVAGAMSVGQAYLLKRNDGVIVAEFWGNYAGNAGVWAEFEYIGGVWRLGANSGGTSDTDFTGPIVSYPGGVIPGAGA